MTHADIDAAGTHIAHALPEGAIGSLAWIGELVRLAHLGLAIEQPEAEWAAWMGATETKTPPQPSGGAG